MGGRVFQRNGLSDKASEKLSRRWESKRRDVNRRNRRKEKYKDV